MHVPKRVIRPHAQFSTKLSNLPARDAAAPAAPPAGSLTSSLAGSLANAVEGAEEVNGPATWMASAVLPTRHGPFRTHVFRAHFAEGGVDATFGDYGPKDHVALVFGDVTGKSAIPVRVHSECMTSEVFGSLKCDCREQLEYAMAEVARRGAGVILYLRQEGRGIGLANKIRAYALQADGLDTVDANRHLGLPDDARTYEVVPEMLAHLDVRSVRLMTNNPDKVTKLRDLGVSVIGRLPVLVEPNAHSVAYLEAKRIRMDHDLPPRGEPRHRDESGEIASLGARGDRAWAAKSKQGL